MSVHGNNATPPAPAIAPGSSEIDPRAVARRFGALGVDPRIRAAVPAFDAPFFQAGLAGYSDAAMRIIARRHGCPFCVTEALLDRTLLAGGRGFIKADLGELHDNVPGGPEDHPLACQIMGSDPDEFAAAALKVAEQGARTDKEYRKLAYAKLTQAEAAEIAEQHLRLPGPDGGIQVGRFDPTEGLGDVCEETCETAVDEINRVSGFGSRGSGQDQRTSDVLHPKPDPRTPIPVFETIDVNLACPVKKIKSKARGGHWLAEPEGAIDILKAVRSAVPSHIPCTVKLRRAFDDTPEMARNCDRILAASVELGYAWATVHARTVEQKYIGPSRWDLLRDLVRRHPGVLIFGSGDVWDAPDIFRMLEYTGVKAVAVARGCIGNPWIFRQARQLMAGEPMTAPSIAEQRDVLEEHFRLSMALHGEDHAGKLMRKFGIRFAAHHPRGEEVRVRFIAVSSIAAWRGVLDEFYGEVRTAAHGVSS